MKRKILLTLAIVLALACVFAVSVCAATVYKTANGETLFSYVDENGDYDFESYEGSFPKTDSEGNELTWYITETTIEGENTVHTVASLKTLGEAGNINSNGAYSFASPVTNKNTVSINFPDNEGIKSFAFNTFGGSNTRKNNNNNALFVYCPNTLTTFANNTFQETNVIVVEIDFETPITSIPQNFAHEARNLEAINIPSAVTVINGSSDRNGAPFYNNLSLVSVNFSENSSLTEIKNACFQNCSSLVSIDLPEGVTSIGAHAFSSCSSLKEISLPNSLVTIANHAFAWCSSIEVIRMGSSFEYFNNTGDNSFTYTTGKVREIYIPKTFYAVAPDTSKGYQVSYAFHGVSANCKFFYCGTAAEFESAKANFLTQKSATSNNGRFLNATVITYSEYMSDLEKYATGNYVVCEYNSCDAFYEGEHLEDNNPCVVNCDRCEAYGVAEKNPEHIINTTVVYESFALAGSKITGCANEGCKYCEKEALEPLFNCIGYSAFEGGNGISIGFMVNLSAIATYTEITGNTVKYGVFAVSQEKLGENSIFDENGNEADGVISAEIKRTDFSAFDIKVVGFTDEQKSKKLALGAYVVCNGEYSYIQESDPDENQKYAFISYGDIVK